MQAREQARENNRFSVLKNHPPHATLPPQARCATAPPHHEASERRAAAKRSNFSITAGERSEPAERSTIHLRPQRGRTTEQMPSPHATLPPQARCATAPPPHEASERRAAAKRSNYSITAGERSEPAERSTRPPSAPRGSNFSITAGEPQANPRKGHHTPHTAPRGSNKPRRQAATGQHLTQAHAICHHRRWTPLGPTFVPAYRSAGAPAAYPRL